MRRKSLTALMAFVALSFVFATRNPADDVAEKPKVSATTPADAKATSKSALTQFQDLVGGWLGTGQPKRGSTAGAWREKADWKWLFEDDLVALEYAVDGGKILKSAQLTFDPRRQEYQLTATEIGEAKDQTVDRTYIGKLSDKKLVLESVSKDDSEARRITITRLNEKRTLVLFERKAAAQNFYSRIAEVGYTREGTRLAESDQTGPECVVTGGAGTIKVSFKGETYWVCCTGCRDAFNDDPEGILAEYKQKLEERKAKKP